MFCPNLVSPLHISQSTLPSASHKLGWAVNPSWNSVSKPPFCIPRELEHQPETRNGKNTSAPGAQHLPAHQLCEKQECTHREEGHHGGPAEESFPRQTREIRGPGCRKVSAPFCHSSQVRYKSALEKPGSHEDTSALRYHS